MRYDKDDLFYVNVFVHVENHGKLIHTHNYNQTKMIMYTSAMPYIQEDQRFCF